MNQQPPILNNEVLTQERAHFQRVAQQRAADLRERVGDFIKPSLSDAYRQSTEEAKQAHINQVLAQASTPQALQPGGPLRLPPNSKFAQSKESIINPEQP